MIAEGKTPIESDDFNTIMFGDDNMEYTVLKIMI